jgi:hypothetical protein
MSEVRGQRSEVSSQRSEVGNQKRLRVLDHASEHLANLLTKRHQLAVLLERDVAAVFAEI